MIELPGDIPGERWQQIVDFPNYWISDHGRVYTRLQQGLRIPYYDEDGYVQITLYRIGEHGGSERKSFLIHRLVAQYFVPNIYDDPEVNHLDGNKHNNRFDNLEWCTPLQNTNHAIVTGLRRGKPRAEELFDEEDAWMAR